MTNTIIDIHILQTVPPSNINRDDTGSPKTAIYGDVRRARVSSQSWKRATRTAFSENLDKSELGQRTKKVVESIAEAIKATNAEMGDKAIQLASGVLKVAGIKLAAPRTKKGEEPVVEESNYLIFLSNNQIARLAEIAIAAEQAGSKPDGKEAKAAANSEHSIDIALFGRMVADATELNVDAAAQVAHAISVHAVNNEFDYFTAVDDNAPADNPGAGMIGTVEFNSSTLYRYATVNVASLYASLGDSKATARAVGTFLRAFVTSMPTGKQNTFANRTLPDAVVVSVREGQPVNLVGAFEEAVVAPEGSTRLAEASRRLAEHSVEIDSNYGTSALKTFVVRVGAATEPIETLGARVSLENLVSGITELTAARLPGLS